MDLSIWLKPETGDRRPKTETETPNSTMHFGQRCIKAKAKDKTIT